MIKYFKLTFKRMIEVVFFLLLSPFQFICLLFAPIWYILTGKNLISQFAELGEKIYKNFFDSRKK